MFRIALGASQANGEPGKMHVTKLFTAQKLIQDPSVRHILSMGVVHTNPEEDLDFTISVGYYAKIMQTIKFVVGFDNDQYTMVD